MPHGRPEMRLTGSGFFPIWTNQRQRGRMLDKTRAADDRWLEVRGRPTAWQIRVITIAIFALT